jgi:molybdopterin molybdotransferase
VRLAGEDVAPGDRAVRAGERLGPGHVALLSGVGVAAVSCRRRPRAVVLVTGDEVTTDAGALADGAVHDVGGPALRALLEAEGVDVVPVRHVGDDRGATVAALQEADANLVVTSGGASVGHHDHVRGALAELGARERVSGLALQPGRPTWLGALPAPDGPRPVLALPGNPGAGIAVAVLLLGPLLRAMTGRPPAPPVRARLAAGTHGDAGRVRALRVALQDDPDGARVARVLEGQQPHRLSSLPATAAFALVPAGAGELPAGAIVEVVPVPGWGV